jgi:hypothetical protein
MKVQWQVTASRLKAFHVVLADFQGHHEWKALAILRMASLQFFAVQASTTPGCAWRDHLNTSPDRWGPPMSRLPSISAVDYCSN